MEWCLLRPAYVTNCLYTHISMFVNFSVKRGSHSAQSRLFAKLLALVYNEQIIKAPYHWPVVRRIHQCPMDSPHKEPECRKRFRDITPACDMNFEDTKVCRRQRWPSTWTALLITCLSKSFLVPNRNLFIHRSLSYTVFPSSPLVLTAIFCAYRHQYERCSVSGRVFIKLWQVLS